METVKEFLVSVYFGVGVEGRGRRGKDTGEAGKKGNWQIRKAL